MSQDTPKTIINKKSRARPAASYRAARRNQARKNRALGRVSKGPKA